MDISNSTAWEHMKPLLLKHVLCRFGPHNLSDGNKEARIRICNKLLV